MPTPFLSATVLKARADSGIKSNAVTRGLDNTAIFFQKTVYSDSLSRANSLAIVPPSY